jgi:hypothetical protein
MASAGNYLIKGDLQWCAMMAKAKKDLDISFIISKNANTAEIKL